MSTLTLGGSIVNVNARQREGVGGKKEVNFGQRKLWTSPKAANFKLTETFMEGAPQSVLQTYIFLVQDESISTTQYITIISSFVIYSYGAVGIYLSQPTKVMYIPKKD